MKHIITISGDIGGGKSAVARCLEKILGYAVIGTGSIQREIAKSRGMTTLELNQLSITDPSIDEEIDGFVINLGKTREQVIVDSRLAWNFIPDSFKAFLIVDPWVGAQRVFGDARAEEQNPSLKKTLDNNRQRQQLEKERFKRLYNVNFKDFRNYDAVIDTSYSPPEAIAAQLAALYQAALRGEAFPQAWLNAKRLLPTRGVSSDLVALESLRLSLRQNGFDNSRPLDCMYADDGVYLQDGHKRALAAHLEGMDLLPCTLAASSGELAQAIAPSWQGDWKAALECSTAQPL